MNFSFEQADRLDWSNKHLDSIIPMRLLLMTYDVRLEAEDFRQRRNELRTKCLAETDNSSGFIKELRRAFPVGPYGTTREETTKIIADFMTNLWSAVIQEAS